MQFLNQAGKVHAEMPGDWLVEILVQLMDALIYLNSLLDVQLIYPIVMIIVLYVVLESIIKMKSMPTILL